VIFYLLPGTVPLWVIVLVLVFYGLGSGFALAALHHAAMSRVPEAQMGAAAGLYSMLRFFGSAIGTALAGVALATFLGQALTTLQAYQYAFLFFAGAGFIGASVGSRLREQRSRLVLHPVKGSGS
jgi:MFS family permease